MHTERMQLLIVVGLMSVFGLAAAAIAATVPLSTADDVVLWFARGIVLGTLAGVVIVCLGTPHYRANSTSKKWKVTPPRVIGRQTLPLAPKNIIDGVPQAMPLLNAHIRPVGRDPGVGPASMRTSAPVDAPTQATIRESGSAQAPAPPSPEYLGELRERLKKMNQAELLAEALHMCAIDRGSSAWTTYPQPLIVTWRELSRRKRLNMPAPY